MCTLKITNIKKYYGTEANLVKAVDNISLNVRSKEFVTIWNLWQRKIHPASLNGRARHPHFGQCQSL